MPFFIIFVLYEVPGRLWRPALWRLYGGVFFTDWRLQQTKHQGANNNEIRISKGIAEDKRAL
jgi:G:T/U-mismatch repair DNA glycosylase